MGSCFYADDIIAEPKASILALVLLAWGGLHVAKFILYPDYYAQGETISKIPALGDGFVPQGLDYDPETDTYIHSGYNGEKAELYLVTGDTTKAIVLLTLEGEQAKGHVGGVTKAGDYLYISDNHSGGDGKVAVSFESACNKYIVGKFFFANKVVAFEIK